MTSERQRQEVDRNYDAFVHVLGMILPEHRDQLALMRDGRIVDYFDTPRAALGAAVQLFPRRYFLDPGGNGRADRPRLLVACRPLSGSANSDVFSSRCWFSRRSPSPT